MGSPLSCRHGRVDCLVPGKLLTALRLKPRGRRTYELADGSEVTLDVTVAEVEFMGEKVGATVIYGPDDAEPILGVTALESVGIQIGLPSGVRGIRRVGQFNHCACTGVEWRPRTDH